MRAFLSALDDRVWYTIENGWTKPTKTVEDEVVLTWYEWFTSKFIAISIENIDMALAISCHVDGSPSACPGPSDARCHFGLAARWVYPSRCLVGLPPPPPRPLGFCYGSAVVPWPGVPISLALFPWSCRPFLPFVPPLHLTPLDPPVCRPPPVLPLKTVCPAVLCVPHLFPSPHPVPLPSSSAFFPGPSSPPSLGLRLRVVGSGGPRGRGCGVGGCWCMRVR
ncbi:unnamed protein product [Prunus armeniaca]|uniref:Uncharacterized protein n=1 Tax=Prunus armeniaca TaxID=36596 RepID=A0A6J5XE51_PRUAR|nr:unnamed protein product [Prunus armeniaca]